MYHNSMINGNVTYVLSMYHNSMIDGNVTHLSL